MDADCYGPPGNLELICFLYNGILSTLLDVERPLVSKQITAIDAALDKGLNDLNWNSHKIEDYISEVMAMLKDLNTVLLTIKGNVTKTRGILAQWESSLMFERKDGKVRVRVVTFILVMLRSFLRVLLWQLQQGCTQHPRGPS